MKNTMYADWDGHYVKLTWSATSTLPDMKYITSVHGVCIHNGKVMLVEVASRGFDLPGGHIEENELPEQSLIRECMEEGYVKCDSISLIGMIEVNHEENPLFNPNGKYPLIGYQLFYRTNVIECLPYKSEYECLSRIFVDPQEIPNLIGGRTLSHFIVNEAFHSIDKASAF